MHPSIQSKITFFLEDRNNFKNLFSPNIQSYPFYDNSNQNLWRKNLTETQNSFNVLQQIRANLANVR